MGYFAAGSGSWVSPAAWDDCQGFVACTGAGKERGTRGLDDDLGIRKSYQN